MVTRIEISIINETPIIKEYKIEEVEGTKYETASMFKGTQTKENTTYSRRIYKKLLNSVMCFSKEIDLVKRKNHLVAYIDVLEENKIAGRNKLVHFYNDKVDELLNCVENYMDSYNTLRVG